MTQSSIAQPFELIFRALEKRIEAQPALFQEWTQALENSPFPASQGDSLARFREWFLMERDSNTLGGPPVQIWAPEGMAEDEPWFRLLDSFLGIFKGGGRETTDGREWIDLWSGRSVLVPLSLPTLDEDEVVVARMTLADERCHIPLPGSRSFSAKGLMEALDRDLSKARFESPHAKLSLLVCEDLFRPWSSVDGEVNSPAHSEDQIRLLLEAEGSWAMNQFLESVEEVGINNTYDLLAFETQVDLDQLRKWVPALFEQAPIPKSHTPNAGPSTDIPDALSTLEELETSGVGLDERFDELERVLGLDPGSTQAEAEPGGEMASPTGPVETAGILPWIEAFRWEHSDLAKEQLQTLEEFKLHLKQSGQDQKDAADIQVADVVGFFMAVENPATLQTRMNSFEEFLLWLNQEQDAPLETLLENNQLDSLKSRLQDILIFNQAFSKVEAPSVSVLQAVNPPRVNSEKQEEVEVAGPLLEAFPAEKLQEGDILRGKWTHGKFSATFLVPKEALPRKG